MELFHGAGSKHCGFGRDDIDDTNAERYADPGPRNAPFADGLGKGPKGGKCLPTHAVNIYNHTKITMYVYKHIYI